MATDRTVRIGRERREATLLGCVGAEGFAVGPSYAQLSSLYLLSTLDVIHVTFWTRLSPPFFFLAGQRSYVELYARRRERAWGRGYPEQVYKHLESFQSLVLRVKKCSYLGHQIPMHFLSNSNHKSIFSVGRKDILYLNLLMYYTYTLGS